MSATVTQRVLVGLAALSLLGVLALTVEPAAIAAALAGLHPGWLLVGLVLHALTVVLRALRFGGLLATRPRWPVLLGVSAVGALAIAALPFRLGEAVRPWMLHRRGTPLGEALGAVVVERVLDVLGLLVLLGTLAALVPAGPILVSGVDLLPSARGAIVGGAVVGVLGVLLLGRAGEPAIRWLERGPPDGAGRRLAAALGPTLREGVRVFGRHAALAGALGTTALVWLSTLGVVTAVLAAAPGEGVDPLAAAVAWAACSAAMVLFPSPGFVGPFEAAVVAALVALGRPPDTAAAIAVALHTLQLGGYILFSGPGLWAAGRAQGAGRTDLGDPPSVDRDSQ